MIGPILLRARKAPYHSERRYLVGGLEVRVLFGDPELEAVLTPALAHLHPGSGDRADLTIRALDGKEAGFEPGFDFPDRPGGAEVDSPSLFSRSPDGFTTWEPLRQALTVVDPEGTEALFWVPEPAGLSPRDRAFPFRMAIHRWARARGLQLVHASGVGTEQGGVLLTGPNGSGKSTAALACLGSDLGFAGDDQVLISLEEPRAFGLYCSAGLDTDHLRARLPNLAGVEKHHDESEPEKALLRLHPAHADWLLPQFPVRAVVVPEVVVGGHTEIKELPASRALAALAPGTIFQLPGAGAFDFAALAGLVRRLPTYKLQLGRDLDAVPALLSDLLRSLAP